MALVLDAILFVLCCARALPAMLWGALREQTRQTGRGKPAAPAGAASAGKTGAPDVICVSHVDWGHVWQRNHHTMSRLARRGRVLYCYPIKLRAMRRYWLRVLRGPKPVEGMSLWLVYPLVIPGIRVMRWVEHLNAFLIGGWLRALSRRHGLGDPVLWYYFPDLIALRGRVGESCCVYDIQDNYRRFFWASPDVGKREDELLRSADLVFTGTHALYEQHRGLAKDAEFIPCGVDVEHFQKARRDSSPPAPAPLLGLTKPVLGYFGMIDERIDLGLIAELARRRPEWSFLLIGPVTGAAQRIEPLANVRFTGHVPYENLPPYARAFDVCLMPFVLSDLTRAINPTKTLEYFALERPVVSTRIPDMVKFYPGLIYFADGADEWEQAIERALAGDPARIAAALALAKERSWEAMTQRFVDRIQEKIKAAQR